MFSESVWVWPIEDQAKQDIKNGKYLHILSFYQLDEIFRDTKIQKLSGDLGSGCDRVLVRHVSEYRKVSSCQRHDNKTNDRQH